MEATLFDMPIKEYKTLRSAENFAARIVTIGGKPAFGYVTMKSTPAGPVYQVWAGERTWSRTI